MNIYRGQVERGIARTIFPQEHQQLFTFCKLLAQTDGHTLQFSKENRNVVFFFFEYEIPIL